MLSEQKKLLKALIATSKDLICTCLPTDIIVNGLSWLIALLLGNLLKELGATAPTVEILKSFFPLAFLDAIVKQLWPCFLLIYL